MSRPTRILLKLLQVVALVILVVIGLATFLTWLLYSLMEWILEGFHDFVSLPLDEKLEDDQDQGALS